MLTPTLQSPIDLFHKLRREQHRAFHAPHPTHLADHLYNFCVTALALRDHLFVALSTPDQGKQAFFAMWLADPARRACSEIANASKHGRFRAEPGTQAVTLGTSTWIDVYLDESGEFQLEPDDDHLDVTITVSDATTLSLYDLTERVIGFWRSQFLVHGIRFEEQSEAELFGESGSEPAA